MSSDKKNIFESIFEHAYKKLKDVQDFCNVFKNKETPNRMIECPKHQCEWKGYKLKSFISHVKVEHKDDYDSLKLSKRYYM